MSATNSKSENATENRCIDSRTERALSECMSVCPNHPRVRDAPGLFVVVGENGNGEYLVDVAERSCTCRDSRDPRRPNPCKHIRRVAILVGDRPIPTWIPDVVDIDTTIGANVDKNVRFIQTDGGVVTTDDDADVWSEPQLEVNRYNEPTGEKYVCCTNCGVEALVGETENASHGPGCIHREGER